MGGKKKVWHLETLAMKHCRNETKVFKGLDRTKFRKGWGLEYAQNLRQHSAVMDCRCANKQPLLIYRKVEEHAAGMSTACYHALESCFANMPTVL